MPSLLGTLQGPMQDPTAQLLLHLLQRSQGHPEQALMSAMQQRFQTPQNLPMRNAEHALFAQVLMQKFGPIVGSMMLMSLVPGYSGAKAIGRPMGFFQGSTPPSLQEMKWGLAPLWGGIPHPPAQQMAQRMHPDELTAEEANIQDAIEDLDDLRDEGKMRQFNREKPLLERRIRAWQMRRQGLDPLAPSQQPAPPGGVY